jgi:hypothetical protein
MPLKTGLNAQLGVVQEVTWGIPVAPTRFYPFLPGTDVEMTRETIEAQGIIAGRRVVDTGQRRRGAVGATGKIQMELLDRSMGLLFTHMFGGAAVTGAGPYTQTYTPGDLDGRGLTTQVGKPDVGGVVRPVTLTGAKVTQWEMACKVGEIATLSADLVGRDAIYGRTVTDGVTNSSTLVTSATAAFSSDDVGRPITGAGITAGTTIAAVVSATNITLSATATATASSVTLNIGPPLASASYVSAAVPLVYTEGSLTVAGQSIPVPEIKITGDNKLKTDRQFLGTPYISEPFEADATRDYMVEFAPEFADLTLLRRFLQQASGALVLTFTSGSNTLTITTNITQDETHAALNGRSRVDLPIVAKCHGTTDAAAITLVTVNGDATA